MLINKMLDKTKTKRGIKTLGIIQVLILVFGIIGIAYVLNSEVEVVSAGESGPENCQELCTEPEGTTTYDNYESVESSDECDGESESYRESGSLKCCCWNEEENGDDVDLNQQSQGTTTRGNQNSPPGSDDRPPGGQNPTNAPRMQDSIGTFSEISGLYQQGSNMMEGDNEGDEQSAREAEGENTAEGSENGDPEDSEENGDENGDDESPWKQGPITGIASLFGGEGSLSGILGGLGWSIGVGGGVYMLGTMMGYEEGKVEAASLAAAGGTLTYQIASSKWVGLSTQWAGVAGIAAAAIIYAATYEDKKQETVSFECRPWDAQTGGENCELCNNQEISCSEYQCKALGQACGLINKGTEEQKCVWIDENDDEYPTITPWEDVLTSGYEYGNEETSPSSKGTEIQIINKDSETECVEAFTPLEFGIKTNEPSKCKLDYTRKQNFSDYDFYFGGSSLFRYNHTQKMSLPGKEALNSQNITLENDGEFELYVKCQDANGNSNPASYVFKYCVEEGPDTTPPVIDSTNINSGTPIAFNQSSVDLEVYVNEPADCKWSHLDQSYENMENQMDCSKNVFEMNMENLYKCETELDGLKDRQENKFYFRCKDKPYAAEEDRNVNSESYEFNLMGTEPLYIDSVKPNNTIISDSTSSVKVTLEAETSAGHNEGEATCYYSETGRENDYLQFYYENGDTDYEHNQELRLTEGEHEYYIRCVDSGGNSDTKKINFEVDTDEESPLIIRTYKEEEKLKLITNEEAKCVYDNKNCEYDFNDGIKLTEDNNRKHYTDWKSDKNLYIKCEDEFENRPAPDECSIIIRPFEDVKARNTK